MEFVLTINSVHARHEKRRGRADTVRGSFDGLRKYQAWFPCFYFNLQWKVEILMTLLSFWWYYCLKTPDKWIFGYNLVTFAEIEIPKIVSAEGFELISCLWTFSLSLDDLNCFAGDSLWGLYNKRFPVPVQIICDPELCSFQK